MSQKQISQWRTVGIVVFACLLLAAVLVFLTLRAAIPLDLDKAERLFVALTDATVWLVGAVALKASVEHLGRGSGVKGAAAALLTDAKPGEPAPVGPVTPPPGGTP